MTHARTRAPATAGQVADWFDAGFSHAGGFQASPKCRDTKEIAPLGHSPSVVDSLVDDLLLRRQPAGEVRGRQGILRGLLPEEETPGKVLCGIPEGRCQTSHAGPAGIGDGNSRPLPSGLPRRWKVGDFIPFGCDGTRQNCPRTEELERRLGSGGKEGSSPTIWNTSIVHLTLGVPFCWRLGKGSKPSERSHLISMLSLLPTAALIVADAGYVGYEVMATMLSKGVFFLIRMSSMATFYTESKEPLEEFREGIVYYWPKKQQKEGKPPLRGRLLRIHSVRHKADVWLFTNVEDPQQLSLEMAATCYRWRWENEGFFRTYKRTLKKATLMSRTVAQVHREAEASMIATQLLLCQGRWPCPRRPRTVFPRCAAPAAYCWRHAATSPPERNPRIPLRHGSRGRNANDASAPARRKNANGRDASHIGRHIRPFC